MTQETVYPEWFMQLQKAVVALKNSSVSDESLSTEDEILALSSQSTNPAEEQPI